MNYIVFRSTNTLESLFHVFDKVAKTEPSQNSLGKYFEFDLNMAG